MKPLLSQNFILSASHALLTTYLQGFGGTILLFALCFFGVHLSKIAVRGFQLYNGMPTEKESKKTTTTPQKTEQQPSAPEPIYYIVEKKRRRSKPSYGDPKEIRFK